MIIIFIRAIITFTTLLIVMRIMGKRQIGEMQPFEFIITLLIAELACIPMADVSIPLIYGIAAIVAVFILHQSISALEQLSQGLKYVVSGKPSLVLNKNGIDFTELKRNNMDVEDLIESMRSNGYFSLDDLDYGIFESNGKFSAKEKPDFDKKKSGMPVLIVSEGKLIEKNFELLKINYDFVKRIMDGEKVKRLKDVGVITVDGNGKMYFQAMNENYKILNVNLPEGVKW